MALPAAGLGRVRNGRSGWFSAGLLPDGNGVKRTSGSACLRPPGGVVPAFHPRQDEAGAG